MSNDLPWGPQGEVANILDISGGVLLETDLYENLTDETAQPSREDTEDGPDDDTLPASAEPSRFPQILKALRKARGLTQKELAEELGIGYGTVIGYENQKREPNARAIVALERYFGVTAAALLGLEDAAPAAIRCDAPDKPLPLNDTETRLLKDFRCLSAENQTTLLRLAAKFAAIDSAFNAWLDANEPC